MSAKIHHLDCGTMCPFGGGLVSGEGIFSSAKMVAHCLLVERENGLLLVDTGFGLDDVRSPAERLGASVSLGHATGARSGRDGRSPDSKARARPS
jgi:hypothetical protein